MVNNFDVQKILVQRLKSYISSNSLTIIEQEVREEDWRGTKYSYPNVRVSITRQDIDKTNCSRSVVLASIFVFSEEYSSDECQTLAYQVADFFQEKTFNSTVTPNDTVAKVKSRVTEIGGAEEVDRIWRVQVSLELQVTQK